MESGLKNPTRWGPQSARRVRTSRSFLRMHQASIYVCLGIQIAVPSRCASECRNARINRRPVDYAIRTKALNSIDGASPAELINDWKSGRIKLNILRRLLRFRRDEAAFFRQADYQGLEVSGGHAEHCVAFLRSDGESHLLVITSRLTASIGGDIVGSAWGDTTIHLPDTWLGCEWHEILSDTTSASDNSDQLSVESMVKHYPFAVAFMSAGSR